MLSSYTRLAAFVLLGLGLLASSSRAATLRVNRFATAPAPDGATWQTAYRTIQSALNAAHSGDELWVRGTTYFEDVVIATSGITMIGGFAGTETTNEPSGAAPTIVTGNGGASPVVSINAGNVAMRGFRIVGGSVGGIRINATGARISGCIIISNGAAGGPGGGIVCEPDSEATIHGNTISKNVARQGAGIRATNATIVVSNNVITENEASYTSLSQPGGADAEGGGIYVDGGQATIKNNVITYNTVSALAPAGTTAPSIGRGGGMAIRGEATVTNNTIALNKVRRPASADHPSGTGGGVYFDGRGVFANNIVASNVVEGETDATHGGLAVGLTWKPGVTVSHNLFHANTPDDSGDYAGTSGNIAADPLFTGGSPFDYTPRPGSPAIDAGDNQWVLDGDVDLAGHPRKQGSRVDIGAYETEAIIPPVIGPDRVYVRPNGSDTADGESWTTAKATIQAAVDAVAKDGAVWVAAGTYPQRLTLKGTVQLLGGFQGTETEASQRNSRANQTILEGDRTGVLVLIPEEATGVTVDGFTIRNGGYRGWDEHVFSWKSGGGIQSAGANTTISNNLIENNQVRLSSENPEVSGAGILIAGGSAAIYNNVVRGNTVEAIKTTPGQFADRVGAFGGGIYLGRADVRVYNNLVVDNSAATVAPYGGDMYTNGGGIYAVAVTGLIANNTIAQNVTSPTRVGNVYSESGSVYISAAAGGLTVANNIIAFNAPGVRFGTTPPAFLNNDVFGNGTDYIGAEPAPGAGNISQNPLFVDRPSANYRLSPESPAIDAGNTDYARGGTDLDGHPRISGAAVDLGAYEFIAFPDALRALRIAGGLDAMTSSLPRLDADGNGSVDIRDALTLLRGAAR